MLRLHWRPFQFSLPQAMVTAHGALRERRGWLLRLEAEAGPQAVGWGEASPLEADHPAVAAALEALPETLRRSELERLLPAFPLPLGFALGAALAELDGLGSLGGEGWLAAPVSAWLLPAGPAMLPALEQVVAQVGVELGVEAVGPPVFKWKVAALPACEELELLERLLQRMPLGARLRLDANGGWDRATAALWAERLAHESRLDWLEQPLDPSDQAGLEALAAQLPVALDESLRADPGLRSSWAGWQVRRPLVEGDPRPLLAALQAGQPHWMVSTALETGIGRRWVHHLAALQAQGPTPTAPGLAPGWCPPGDLFAADPWLVWAAAA